MSQCVIMQTEKKLDDNEKPKKIGSVVFLVLHQDQFSDVLNRLPIDAHEKLQKTARERLQKIKY